MKLKILVLGYDHSRFWTVPIIIDIREIEIWEIDIQDIEICGIDIQGIEI